MATVKGKGTLCATRGAGLKCPGAGSVAKKVQRISHTRVDRRPDVCDGSPPVYRRGSARRNVFLNPGCWGFTGSFAMNDDLVTITNEFIESGRTPTAGQTSAWNYRQLRLLGVTLPPQKGWKWEIIGTKISKEAAAAFLALRGFKSKKPRKRLRKLRVENSTLPSPAARLAERARGILQRRHWAAYWNGRGWTVDATADESVDSCHYSAFSTFLDENDWPCPFEAVVGAEDQLTRLQRVRVPCAGHHQRD